MTDVNWNDGKEFTVQELRYWSNPRTWFRKKLVERPSEEFTPELRGALDEIVLIELPYLKRQIGQGDITKQYYDKQIALLRRLGNILYI